MIVHEYDGADLTDAVALANEKQGFATGANLGESEQIPIVVDDPDGTYSFVGHKLWRIRETAAPSGDQVIWVGFVGKRARTRAVDVIYPNAAGCQHDLTLIEASAYTSRRILNPTFTSGTKRPQETVSARVAWLLTTPGYSGLVVDAGLVASSAVVMDEHDYGTGAQTGKTVLDECAAAAGFNWGIRYREATEDFELLFFDFLTFGDDISALRISNDPDDPNDDGVTFRPNDEAKLWEDPNRRASGVELAYGSGALVYVRDAALAAVIGEVDLSAPSSWVKLESTATALAEHYAEQHSTEEEYADDLEIEVPAESVNIVKPGQLMVGKFTHGNTAWRSFRFARVTRKVVKRPDNLDQERHRLALRLSPASGELAFVAANIMLYGPNDNNVPVGGNGTFIINYDTNGDGVGTEPLGCPPSVLAGPLAYMGASTEWTGVESSGVGTVLVDSVGTVSGASPAGSITLTARILKNGSMVHQVSTVISGGAPFAVGWTWSMRNKPVSVQPGDQIQTQLTVSGLPGGGGYVIPNGVGNCHGPDAEQLWVRGTLLV